MLCVSWCAFEVEVRGEVEVNLCMAILEGGVASVPGEAFGLDGYIRFSFATSEEKLKEAGARIVKTLVSIKPN